MLTEAPHYAEGEEKGRMRMEAGRLREEFSYQCQSCQDLLDRLPQGTCPTCGSDAVVSLGWSQRLSAEYQDWLTRIRGGHKKKSRSPVPAAAE